MPEELPSGFVFGGYVLGECIGRGGMARVYRAEHTALKKAVALKVLDTWVVEKPGGKERFLREARTAASIKHPSVVDIIDLGVLSERPYIVMELLDGCDLESELERRGALSDVEVVRVALPVIAGMMAVHEAGVVHRDIKPSNIFLAKGADGEVTPKVLDFGISKFSDSLLEPIQGLTKTREIVGTPTYMAPEALNGARGLGPCADQYALGAVLYDCSVGRPPFEGSTLLELLKAIAVGDIVPPRSIRPEISPQLEAAILRAMSANPNARFETLRDLGGALWPLGDERTQSIWSRAFGNAVSPKTRPLGGPATVNGKSRVRSKRTRWWSLPLAATAVVGLSSWLVWYWIGSGPPPASTASPASDPGVSVAAQRAAPLEPASPVAARDAEQVAVASAALLPGSRPEDSKASAKAAKRADPNGTVPGARKRVSRRSPSQERPRARAGDDAQDSDLAQMFQLTGADESREPGSSDADSELRALFPASATTQSAAANGAPLPD